MPFLWMVAFPVSRLTGCDLQAWCGICCSASLSKLIFVQTAASLLDIAPPQLNSIEATTRVIWDTRGCNWKRRFRLKPFSVNFWLTVYRAWHRRSLGVEPLDRRSLGVEPRDRRSEVLGLRASLVRTKLWQIWESQAQSSSRTMRN